jgi:hypothetical protein
MSFGFKLIVPCALTLYLAAACVPDLDSLSATYSANSIGGTGGTDENPEGGTGNIGTGGTSANLKVCENGVKDSKESDVDCGGTSTCDRCKANSKCTSNNDCDSKLCKSGRCTAASCTDNVLNQDETGTDCGGTCLPCDLGVACASNDGCTSEYCLEGVCADHCGSGAREADETDIDCGGSCPTACADKDKCVEATDCKSQICTNLRCAVASCNDGVKNQTESDIDCGGVCSSTKPCPTSAKCNSEADCASWICNGAGKCVADTVVVEADAVIDDYEDGDITNLPALGGRAGNWYAYGDGTGSGLIAEAVSINRGASIKGLHTKGKDFGNWGSGVGCDLAHGTSEKLPYDASAYKGVTFWAKGTGVTTLNVAFPDIDTDNLVKGKTCTTCDHHYYKSVPLTAAWQRINIAFADLALEPGNLPTPVPAFKPEALSSVQFRMTAGANYDVYIDDLAFVK